MKLKILFIMQTIALVFFIILSIIKNAEVKKALLLAERQTLLAMENVKQAQLEAQRAEWAAAKYVKIESKLKNCESNK